ncbi:hypothetical protein F441_15837 [Phytophthora nicotianae CJ01A1]|uniref:Uncharacterized protein n=6 Tax=Phytophthora nicotianae TaxID=4792 RepID=W2PU71_PHYN3|nr:hypothetical protein PPTG_23755 [Phytophthora nicotianae INRA-310]ETI38190.1 hypothetical protein F443_16001 [Phytophthora nicotianae P1569]ETK78402.1 hypothetical protein L915_15548 [Phytophthora nicotianae]ETO66966.1 hypothetical protein F444_15982 [Phytophthora nicotianae P1976]ETP08074.1 hypothetical protein F441_15837 [Phytophthora nicotianae CJ01A1]ETP36126.1 hypothetical protein F442_15847 [Phytophthora nicotianae P10297]
MVIHRTMEASGGDSKWALTAILNEGTMKDEERLGIALVQRDPTAFKCDVCAPLSGLYVSYDQMHWLVFDTFLLIILTNV